MKVEEMAALVGGKVRGSLENMDYEITKAFASDLMSDVLREDMDDTVLITGLCNIQTVRTADMAELRIAILSRGKVADDEMVEMAEDIGLTIIESPFATFRISGLLYDAGLQPFY